MASQSQPNPLSALNAHMEQHANARNALWQQIDDAVAAAHAELETERNSHDNTPSETLQTDEPSGQ